MRYVVHKYNTSMGGTDHQDQNVNKYRVSIRTKKWWCPLFSRGIDVTIQNTHCFFVQVIQDGVYLSLDGTLSGVHSK